MGNKTLEVVDLLLSATNWGQVSAMSGSGFAEMVPAGVLGLLESVDEADVLDAYWRVDNVVVVQGQLFQSAEHVVLPLLVGLQAPISPASKRWALELLVQIAFGVVHRSEVARGNTDLHLRCRAQLELGSVTYYALLTDDDPRVREAAIDLLSVLETNRRRLRAVLEALQKCEMDETNRKSIADALQQEEG